MIRKFVASAVLAIVAASACGAAELKLPLLWTAETKTLIESAPTVADINGDGLCEVLAAGREDMIAIGHGGKILWRWRTAGRFCTYPAVLQRKGEPALIYAADGSGLMTCLNGNGKVVWQAHLKKGANWSASVVADLDHDGRYAVIQTDESGTISAFDALTGKVRWQASMKGLPISPAIGDVDGDGHDEIAVASNAGVLALFSSTGKLRWQRTVSGISETWATSAPIIFGASDGSGRIAVGANEGRVSCFNAAGKLLWERATSGSVTSTLSAGDMDHDGRADVFAITQTGIIYRFDEDGRELWKIDMQGRTIGAGALIDLRNDGHIDYVMSTQSGRLFVFNDRGQSIFQHVFQNRTINMTPAFGNVTPGSPDLDMVLTGGESGRVFCFGTPARADAPASGRQWISYRADNHKTGAWFGLTQTAGAFMGPRDASWDLMTGDPAVFTIHVPETKNLPLKATARCVRPDGSLQSADTPVYGATGQIPLPIDVTQPGTYRFSWSVEDSKGTKLAGGQHAVFLQPFANDRALVARALAALRDTAARVDSTLPLSAHALMGEALALEQQARSAEQAQAAMAGGGGPAEQTAAGRTIPLVAHARHDLALAEAIDEAKDLGPTASVLAFQTTLWNGDGIDQQVPADAQTTLTVARPVVPGEHDPVSVKLLNITDRDLQVRVIVEPGDGGPAVTAMRSIPVPTDVGGTVWDPLPALGESLVVTIPSLSTREVWLDSDFAGVEPGKHEVKVRFMALNGAGVLEGPASERGVPAPETLADITYNVLPFAMAPSGAFRMCLWATYGPGVINDLLAHGDNVFCVPQGDPKYDGQGNLTGYDYTKLDAMLTPLHGHDVVVLVQGQPSLKAAAGTPEYRAQFKTWLMDLKAHMAAMGFTTEHFAMYPYDEPGGNGWNAVNGLVAFGKMVKSIDPSVRIYVDGGAEVPMIEKMRDVVDIWCPGLGQLADTGPEIAMIRATHKEIWSYDCGYGYANAERLPIKNTNVVGDYRVAALFAMRWGANGIGFWAYNIGDDPWQRSFPDYPIVYPGKTRPVDSRRWEAVRQGVQDYRILAALQKDGETVKDPALRERIHRLFSVDLPALLDRGTQEVVVGLGQSVLNASRNDAVVDAFRKEMFDCVEAVAKENGAR